MTTINRRSIPEICFKISGLHSFFSITLVWVMIIGVWAACVSFDNVLVTLAGAVIIGVLQYHLNILGHDGLHWGLFSDKRANDLVCRIFLHGPQAAPMTMLRANHMNHHSHLGDKKDNDSQYYNIDRFGHKYRFIVWLAGSFFGGMTVAIVYKLLFVRSDDDKPKKASKIRSSDFLLDVLTTGVVQIVIFLLLWSWSDALSTYFVLWLFPLFTLMFGLNVMRSCLEHAQLKGESNRSRLYTFESNLIERVVLAPWNMNYHAEHHMFPSVPWFRLPLLRDTLQKKGVDLQLHSGYVDRLRVLVRDYEKNC